jgi:hypothetical protein
VTPEPKWKKELLQAIVSRSGTKHLAAAWKLDDNTLYTLCRFTIHPGEALPEASATRECECCAKALAEIERKVEVEVGMAVETRRIERQFLERQLRELRDERDLMAR